MMCWKFYRPERNLISHTVMLHNHLMASCLHTNFSLYEKKTEIDGNVTNQTTESNKLDEFVATVKSRYKSPHKEKYVQLGASHFNKKHEAKLTSKIEKQSSVHVQNWEYTQLKRIKGMLSEKEISQKNTLLVTDKFASPSEAKIAKVNLDSDQNHMTRENLVEGNSNLHENIMSGIKADLKKKYEAIVSETNSSSPFCQYKEFSKQQQIRLMSSIKSREMRISFIKIEEYIKNDFKVPFSFFEYFCGVAGTLGLVDEVLKIKNLARKAEPLQYVMHLRLDNYLASALYFSGDIRGAFDKLHSLYQHYSAKRLQSSTELIISSIMETNNLENEEMVLKFVSDVAEKQKLKPALYLWSAGFCSSIYRHQKIAERLLERHPEMLEILPVKIPIIIDIAYSSADVELLHRIIEFLLLHQLSNFYARATSALLKYQCDIGNARGILHTIKFAKTLKIQLKPSEIWKAMHHIHEGKLPPRGRKHRRHPPPLPEPYCPSDFPYKF